MRRFYYIISAIFFIYLGCQYNREMDSSLILFHPNTDICISEVLSHGGIRENGIDIDLFKFQRNDTTVIIQFDTDTTFLGYQWFIPIPNDIPDSMFLNVICKEYNIILNQMNNTMQCVDNKLVFSYYLGFIDDDVTLKPNRYFVVFYDPITPPL